MSHRWTWNTTMETNPLETCWNSSFWSGLTVFTVCPTYFYKSFESHVLAAIPPFSRGINYKVQGRFCLSVHRRIKSTLPHACPENSPGLTLAPQRGVGVKNGNSQCFPGLTGQCSDLHVGLLTMWSIVQPTLEHLQNPKIKGKFLSILKVWHLLLLPMRTRLGWWRISVLLQSRWDLNCSKLRHFSKFWWRKLGCVPPQHWQKLFDC